AGALDGAGVAGAAQAIRLTLALRAGLEVVEAVALVEGAQALGGVVRAAAGLGGGLGRPKNGGEGERGGAERRGSQRGAHAAQPRAPPAAARAPHPSAW